MLLKCGKLSSCLRWISAWILAQHSKSNKTCRTEDVITFRHGFTVSVLFPSPAMSLRKKRKEKEAPDCFEDVAHGAIMTICYMLETRCLQMGSQKSQDSAILHDFFCLLSEFHMILFDLDFNFFLLSHSIPFIVRFFF